MEQQRATDRLTLPQRRELKNLVASWEMEGMTLTSGEIDVLARQLLGEFDAVQAQMEIAARLHGTD